MDVNSFVIGFKKGKASVPPSSGGGGAELNIAYGDTAPEDTTKLWVKTSEPNKVIVYPPSTGVEIIGQVKNSKTLETTRRYNSVVSGSNKIYSIGGVSTGASSGSNKSYEYNPVTNDIASFSGPNTTYSRGSALVGNTIYLFGGYSGTSYLKVISKVDIDTKVSNSSTTSVPSSLKNTSCCAVGEYIFLFGGQDNAGKSTQTWRFNTTDEKINKIATIPVTDVWNSVKVGDKIWLFGESGYILTFDPVSYEFETETSLGLNVIDCVVVGDYIALAHHKPATTNTYNTETYLSLYDPVEKSILETKWILDGKLTSKCLGVYGNTVYLFGADCEVYTSSSTSTSKYGTYIYAIDISFPSGDISEGDLVITQAQTNTFAIVNGESAKIELGVNKVYKVDGNNKMVQVESAIYKNGTWTNT